MSPGSEGAPRASRLPVRLRQGAPLVALCLLLAGVARVAFAAAPFSRASLSSAQAEGNASSGVDRQAVSGDGRYVVFTSDATNLVTGDTNSSSDVFLRDQFSNTTERISVDDGGGEADSFSGEPAITPDGRYVAFSSFASNLIGAGNDTNSATDIYLRDRQANTVERISVAATLGDETNGGSSWPSISADGRYVAFYSAANNLIAGDGGNTDVFVRDRQTSTTTRVSVSTGGTAGNSFSLNPSISADGRYVAFESNASNLVAGDTNTAVDVFLRDRTGNTTTRVSVSTAGVQAIGTSTRPSINADGRYIAFESTANNLTAGDSGHQDVFVRDRISNSTRLISANLTGVAGNSASTGARISDDGLLVVFESLSSDLVAGDNNALSDVFVRDIPAATTYRASASSTFAQATGGDSQSGAISGDGRFVAFASDAINLVPSDLNGSTDVFERDLDNGLSPVAPSGLDATAVNATQIKLTWIDNSGNESYFEIQRDAGSGWVLLATAPANTVSYTDLALSPGTLYIYQVRAVNGIGGSEFSNPAATETLETKPAAPTNLVATVGSQTKINLTWVDNALNEDEFRVEQRIGAGAFGEIAAVGPNVTNYAVNGLTPNTQYTYRVRAHNTGGFSAYATSAAVTTLPLPPAAPTAMTTTGTDSSHVALHWTDNANSESAFKIERKIGGGAYSQLASVGANIVDYVDTSASVNQTYTYRVRAMNTGGYSAYATAPNVLTLAGPTNLAAVASPGLVKLTWVEHAANESGYHVERKVGAGAFIVIATTGPNVQAYNNTTVATSTTYTYRIRAYAATSFSSYSNSAAVTTPPPPPAAPSGVLLQATDSTHLALSWSDNATTETNYQVERKMNAGAYAPLVTLPANTVNYTDATGAPNNTYTYRVHALNTGGNSADATSPSVVTLGAPTGLTLQASAGQIKLTWTDNTGLETGFKIERKVGAGMFVPLQTVAANTTTYTDIGLASGTTYTYRLRAYATNSISSLSNTAAATTP